MCSKPADSCRFVQRESLLGLRRYAGRRAVPLSVCEVSKPLTAHRGWAWLPQLWREAVLCLLNPGTELRQASGPVRPAATGGGDGAGPLPAGLHLSGWQGQSPKTTKTNAKAFQRWGWISAEAALEQLLGGRTRGEFGLEVNSWEGRHCESFPAWGAMCEDASGLQQSLQWNLKVFELAQKAVMLSCGQLGVAAILGREAMVVGQGLSCKCFNGETMAVCSGLSGWRANRHVWPHRVHRSFKFIVAARIIWGEMSSVLGLHRSILFLRVVRCRFWWGCWWVCAVQPAVPWVGGHRTHEQQWLHSTVGLSRSRELSVPWQVGDSCWKSEVVTMQIHSERGTAQHGRFRCAQFQAKQWKVTCKSDPQKGTGVPWAQFSSWADRRHATQEEVRAWYRTIAWKS